MSIHTYIQTNKLTYIHTNIHTYIRIHTYAYIHTYIRIHIYAYIHTYIHTYAYIHTYIHRHTYIHTYEHTSEEMETSPSPSSIVSPGLLFDLLSFSSASVFAARALEALGSKLFDGAGFPCPSGTSNIRGKGLIGCAGGASL